jgi:hypothetical protein
MERRTGNIFFMVFGTVVALICLFIRFILHEQWIWVPKVQNWGPTWYFILVGAVFFSVGLVGMLRREK